jgi:hypothetical protein
MTVTHRRGNLGVEAHEMKSARRESVAGREANGEIRPAQGKARHETWVCIHYRGSPLGGGISNTGALTITSSQINDNSVDGDGGGLWNSGGTVTITSSSMSGNTAGNNGGAIYNDGDHLKVSSCTITGNTATLGGGIAYHNGKPKIINRQRDQRQHRRRCRARVNRQ